MSKYMRQIFTAMKPVFTDLASEVQRSLGFYSSSGAGREKGFAKVIAVGGGMKLQGLAKYLQQTLNVPVVKSDSFERLQLGDGVSAAKFHENILDFGVCYGLGVQLLGESKIDVNLLPRKIARAIAWRRKSKVFALAAGLLVFVSVLSFVKANLDKAQYKGHESERLAIQATIRSAQTAKSNWSTARGLDKGSKELIKKEMVKFSNRDIVPSVNQMIMACLPNKENNPGQAELYDAFVSGDVDAVINVPRNERKQLFVTSVSVTYAPTLEDAKFSTKAKSGTRSSRMPEMGGRGFEMSSYEEYGGRMPGGRGGMDPRGGYGGRGMPTPVSPKGDATEDDTAEGPGFLVVIEGYSPYKEIRELLDPHSVGNDESKWGFVTRLVNVSKVVKGSRFELYKKPDRTHFILDMGPVDLMTKDVPVGIGIEKEVERYVPEIEPADRGGAAEYGGGRMGGGGRMRGMDRVYVETVLVDPMTNEEMSTVFDINTDEDVANDPALSEKDIGKKKYDTMDNEPLLIERDYWFRVKAKFRWKGAPELPEPEIDDMMGMGMGMGMGRQ
jgi:type IV pilus assembly protein PilM